MIRPRTPLTLVFALAILSLGTPAQAQSDEGGDAAGSYWELAFAGGMLMPLAEMTELHQQSLSGGLRVGWVSRLGLGVDLAVDYSPLSREQSATQDIYDVHFVTAGLMPRFTLGKRMFRLWLAAGGGLAYEHSEHVESAGGVLEPSTNRYAPASMGAAGVELHAFSGVGLAIIGSYTRTFGDFDYQLVNVTGGLAMTFR